MLNHSIAQEIKSLAQDLCQFGLDPKDWRLIRESSQQYRIESLWDQDFVFIGRIFEKEGSLLWDQISLEQI